MSHHLVTGGAGFVGSALVRRLVEQGHDVTVTVLDRMSRGKSERVPYEARVITADVRDPERMLRAVWPADVVWHLAYVQGTQTFYADPKDVIDVALRGIMSVLRACERRTVSDRPQPELFLVSSSEAYQIPPADMFPTDETVPLSVPDVTNPRYSYGGGKIASEIATLAYAQAGLLERAIVIRPHNIYGPDMGRDHVIPQFAERMMGLAGPEPRDFPIQGTGLETRSFCYISDCIDGFMTLLEHGADRNVYHLGNPHEEHAIADLAYLMAEWFGERIRLVPGELPKGSPTRRLPDIGKLAALGYKPKVPLALGLDLTLDWYRSALSPEAA